jgi:hypothetical protein
VVTILTSAVGLGLYIPALLIERQLRARQLAVDVEVLEGYYTPSYREAHLEHRNAHHASFALAKLAHRMARGVEHCLDAALVETLLFRWRQQERRHFIVWAGFWLPLLERYRKMLGRGRLEVDHCRIDAVVSASFKVHPELDAAGHEVWLWNWARRRIEHEIPVSNEPPLPFAARSERLVVHGGGWGIGTYQTTVPELAQAGYALDVVIHDLVEAPPARVGDRAFMLDPQWQPWWHDDTGISAFPPMIEVIDRAAGQALRNADHHPLYDVIRTCKAIVSKPGGCTLIDSLGAATPVVLLEAYGYGEESNARLWEHLGFGISHAAWRATGYDPAVLARLHGNILNRTRGTNYPRAYAEQLVETCA